MIFNRVFKTSYGLCQYNSTNCLLCDLHNVPLECLVCLPLKACIFLTSLVVCGFAAVFFFSKQMFMDMDSALSYVQNMF